MLFQMSNILTPEDMRMIAQHFVFKQSICCANRYSELIPPEQDRILFKSRN